LITRSLMEHLSAESLCSLLANLACGSQIKGKFAREKFGGRDCASRVTVNAENALSREA
jgi:hypothetical protein